MKSRHLRNLKQGDTVYHYDFYTNTVYEHTVERLVGKGNRIYVFVEDEPNAIKGKELHRHPYRLYCQAMNDLLYHYNHYAELLEIEGINRHVTL